MEKERQKLTSKYSSGVTIEERLVSATTATKPSTDQESPTNSVTRNIADKKSVTTTATQPTTASSPSPNNNSTPLVSESVSRTSDQPLGDGLKKKDPQFRLTKPADFDDFWYKGEDGQMYNEYNDDLEDGYYYDDATAEETFGEKTIDNRPIGSLPRPADYDDFWYEGDDGQMYNEYDDELEDGQFYEVTEQLKLMNGTTGHPGLAQDVIVKVPAVEAAKPADDASKAAEEAAKAAAEEAAKAAAEASKTLLKGMSSLGGGLLGAIKTDTKPGQQVGFGFGLGGLFGSSEPEKKPPTSQPNKGTAAAVLSREQGAKAEKKPAGPAKPVDQLPAAVPAVPPVEQHAPAEQQLAGAQTSHIKPEKPVGSLSTETPEADTKTTMARRTAADASPTDSAVASDATAGSRPAESKSAAIFLTPEVFPASATEVLGAKETKADAASRLPCSAGFSARQRWKWSYAMVKKVNRESE